MPRFRSKKATENTPAEAVPAARHRELPGQTHNVSPDVLAPAVVEFLLEPTAARATWS